MPKTTEKSKNKPKVEKKAKRAKTATLADVLDKYDLYLASVQEPECEVDFFNRAFKAEFDRKPMKLREDFCAAAAVCCEWVKSHKQREAIGVDLDPEPLQWGKDRLIRRLKDHQAERLVMVEGDALHKHPVKTGAVDFTGGADIVAGQNFSYWLFKTRDALRDYFKATLANLADEGILVLDMMGGGDCYEEEHEDTRHIDGSHIPQLKQWAHPDGHRKKGRTSTFEYVWEQHSFNPITADATFFIHFRLPDDSEIVRAFRYDWRFWTIPEVRELLLEAGYHEVHVYWEGTTEDGEGDGVFRKRKSAPSDPSWIAYVVAVKK